MQRAISATVGLNAINRPEDVRLVQFLLNNAPLGEGGPKALLLVDGICGQLTKAAISSFQFRQMGWADCLVSPGLHTIQRLNSFSYPADPQVIAVVGKAIYSCRWLFSILSQQMRAELDPWGFKHSIDEAETVFLLYVGGASRPASPVNPPSSERVAQVVVIAVLAVLVVVLLALAAAEAAPKKDANVIERLRDMAKRLRAMSKRSASNLRDEAREDDRKLIECKEKVRQIDPERVTRCENLFGEEYEKAKSDYLKALTNYITSPWVFTPGIDAIRTQNVLDLDEIFDSVLTKLRFCLGCTN